MPTPLDVLIVEDQPADAELLLLELQRSGFAPTWRRVDTEEAFLHELAQGPDIVLSDFQMPRFNGFRALELLRERGLEVPFILVSGTIGEDLAVLAMKNGATDYLLKDRLVRLGPAVIHALAESQLRRERRQSAEELRAAHGQLKQLLEQSPGVLYVLKFAGDKLVPHLVSESVTNLLGFAVEETLTDEWWFGQLHPDDRERAQQSRTETIESGSSRFEYRLRHKNGHYCWVDDARRVIRDAAGAPIELIGVWTDITQRKRAEGIVQQASSQVVRSRRRHALIEAALIVGAIGLVYMLATYTNWFFWITQWFLARDVEKMDEIILTAILTGVGLAVFAFRRWREAESELTGNQQIQAALGLVHEELDRRVKQRTVELDGANRSLRLEIAERSQAETALRESEAQFRQVVENIEKVVSIVEPAKGRLVYISPAYERIWGRSCASLYATPLSWLDAIYPDDRGRIQQADQDKAAGRSYDEEYRIVLPDASLRWIHDRAFPVRNAAGELDRFVGMAEDITARKQLEEQFRQAQKMEAIGTLAGGIAHDFNNILAAINGYTELAQMILQGNPEVRGYLDSVLQASSRATDLVRQILTFSRQRQPERRAIQLQPVVLESLKLLRATIPSTIEFDTSFATDAPTVLADATQIHQLLMNLGTNASHAMKDQPGRLQVKLEKFVVDAPFAAATRRLQPGIYARVSIGDTGCGMDQATLQRIFEPFFTTKPLGEGTGLGLAVVHGIMDSHDGAVTVYSQPGEGTVFRLYFPAHVGEIAIDAAEERPIPRGQGEAVLVIDDEEVLASLIQKTLIKLGYHVEYVTNPTAALALVRAYPERFRLVLSDQTMPGMTGLALATQLRVIRRELPVILMTGYSLSLTAERVAAAGVHQLILKPISIHALATAVQAALEAAP